MTLSILEPIDPQTPCGPNLEYDTEYLLLLSKLQPKEGAQYGDFIDAPIPVNWTEIQKECLRLMHRSIDIHLLVIYTRCLTRTQHAEGFAEGIQLLQQALEKYAEDINPPKMIDGEEDLLVRANALSGLSDPEGFLGDLREMVLVKNTALRLQLRDVERAFLIPRPNDALAVDSVIQQIQELFLENNPALIALLQGYDSLLSIEQWAKEHLNTYAPDFSSLLKIFAPFQRPEILQYRDMDAGDVSAVEDRSSVPLEEQIENLDTSTFMPEDVRLKEDDASKSRKELKPIADPKMGRRVALEEIKKIRLWFELHEPSSPVVLFLKQAEKSVGKRFSEVVKSIPIELLEQWDAPREGDNQDAL